MFKIEKKTDCGIIIFKIPNFVDERGEFTKLFNSSELENIGIKFKIKEHFFSISKKDVIRGMHFQTEESAHNKIIQCISGSILDVCVDVRKKSKFFNIPFSFNISGDKAIFIPKGFAHGFLSLEDRTIVQYLTDKEYNPYKDKGVLWKSINFKWPVENPLLSSRDSNHPSIKEQECIFF